MERKRRYYLQVLISSDSNASSKAWPATTQKTGQNGMFEWLITRPFFFLLPQDFHVFQGLSPAFLSVQPFTAKVHSFLPKAWVSKFPYLDYSKFPDKSRTFCFVPTVHAFCSSRDILSMIDRFRGKNETVLFTKACSIFLNSPNYLTIFFPLLFFPIRKLG